MQSTLGEIRSSVLLFGKMELFVFYNPIVREKILLLTLNL